MDPLRNDTSKQLLLPSEYSELLQPVCGGHALWAPRRVDRGGGALGDAGYISHGAFLKEFNAYEDPPEGVQPLERPTVGMHLDDQFNMPIMKSSQDCTIEFRITGTTDTTALPLSIAPLTVEPKIVLQKNRVAFLAPPVPARRDTLSMKRREELCEWLTQHRRSLSEGMIIVTEAIRSSGWVGGIATGRKTEVSLTTGATVTNAGGLTAGATAAFSESHVAPIQGPDDWSPTDSAGYTLIINYATARTRAQRLMRKIKLRLSSASPLQNHETPASESPNQSGKNAGTDVTENRSGATEPPPLDSGIVVSGADEEIGDPALLTDILDVVLDRNCDVDVAVADWGIITQFFQTYNKAPAADAGVLKAAITTRIVPSSDGASEVVAIVHSLSPVPAENGPTQHDTMHDASAHTAYATTPGATTSTPGAWKSTFHRIIVMVPLVVFGWIRSMSNVSSLHGHLHNACSRIWFGLYALAAKALFLSLLLGYDIVITILNAVTRDKPTNSVVDLWPEGQRNLWPRYERPKATDSRSPCVALNCMANMGILPRDGRNITFPDLERAVMQTYNTSRTFATLVTHYAATILSRDFKHDTLDLSDLCVHNVIEHDASFTRHDTYLQPDQSKPAEDLVDFVLCSATGRNKLGEPRLTVSDLITISTNRRADCRVENPQFTQTFFHKILGSSKRATLTDIFGGNVKDLEVILREERLPEGWEPSSRSRFGITIQSVSTTALAVELGIQEERGPRRIQLPHGL